MPLNIETALSGGNLRTLGWAEEVVAIRRPAAGRSVEINQPSVQWHLVQMIGAVRLTARQHRRAVALLKHHLENATDWIVLNYTLEVFAQFARADDTLRDYFFNQLQRHNPHKSVAKLLALR